MRLVRQSRFAFGVYLITNNGVYAVRGGNCGGLGGGGASTPQFDMTRKIFIKVGYFDLQSGERNLIHFLILVLFM